MTTILDKIAAYKKDEIAAAKKNRPRAETEAAARHAPRVRDFRGALQSARAQGRHALITELKKASPSKGLIRKDFDVATLARAYEAGGAACLSVLTDGPSFQGADEFLSEARAAANLPVLRKDFMLDPYQVAQARALGADCILIIMGLVSEPQARELEATAFAWGMDALIEVHDEAELEAALSLQSPLIGINNRDLKTFQTDLAVTERLAPLIPEGHLIVAESGLYTRADLDRLAAAGAGAFLIGESLMREADVAAATRALVGETLRERKTSAP